MRGNILNFSLLSATLALTTFATSSAYATPLDKTAGQINPAKIIDLTHTLSKDIPNYQNDKDAYQYTTIHTIAKNGYSIGSFKIPEHFGTHIDAPNHFSEGGKSIDQLPTKDLILPCVVIDVRNEVAKNPDYALTLDKIKAFEKAKQIPAHSAVLLLTGWSQRWSTAEKYRNADAKDNLHFPGFSGEAADFLVDKRHVDYLGIDTLSLDPGNSQEFPVHHHSLTKGIFLIENLTALEKLPARGALLFCAPLKIKGGTGSPARIFALLP